MGLNLYRDGRDSVAWHGDHIAKEIAEPVVAIVSVGEPRTFLLRPVSHNRDVPPGGRRTLTFHLGRGDLLVTGGACQRRWQHTVPGAGRSPHQHHLPPRPRFPGVSRIAARPGG